jgi:hypothetical protein
MNPNVAKRAQIKKAGGVIATGPEIQRGVND